MTFNLTSLLKGRITNAVLSQALALLIDYVHKEDTSIRIGAILGLGIAYAGSHKDEVYYPRFLLYF